MAIELDLTWAQKAHAVLTGKALEQRPSGFSVVRNRLGPTGDLVTSFEARRQAQMEQEADVHILFKNVDHEVSAARTADDLLRSQDKDGVEYNVLGLSEIQTTSLDEGRTLDDVQLIAGRLGKKVNVATPYYWLGKQKFALTPQERRREWAGSIAILSDYEALPGSEEIYDLGMEHDGDEIGSKGGWDIYARRWGVPVFIAAALQHPRGELRVATTHFPTSTESQAVKLGVGNRFVQLVDSLGIDVAGGDINASPRTPVAQIVFDGTRRCDDGTDDHTYRGAWGTELLRFVTQRRLDTAVQGLASKVEVIGSQLVDKGTSDHRGIKVSVRMPRK